MCVGLRDHSKVGGHVDPLGRHSRAILLAGPANMPHPEEAFEYSRTLLQTECSTKAAGHDVESAASLI